MFGLACNGGTHVMAIADEYLKGNPDKLVIALNIEYLGSSISPNNCLKFLLPLPTAFSKLLY